MRLLWLFARGDDEEDVASADPQHGNLRWYKPVVFAPTLNHWVVFKEKIGLFAGFIAKVTSEVIYSHSISPHQPASHCPLNS